MTVSAKTDFEIEATPDAVMGVLLDVESLPEWSDPHKSVEVLERDDDSRPSLVRIEVSMIGLSDQQTLRYSWTDNSCEWELVESKILDTQHGRYEVTPSGDGSHVEFTLEIDLKIKVPGLVVKRGQKIAVDTAAKGLTKEVQRRTAAA